MALEKQSRACSSDGEPYRPIAVDLVLGRKDVRLVDSRGKLVEQTPTAADLFGA